MARGSTDESDEGDGGDDDLTSLLAPKGGGGAEARQRRPRPRCPTTEAPRPRRRRPRRPARSPRRAHRRSRMRPTVPPRRRRPRPTHGPETGSLMAEPEDDPGGGSGGRRARPQEARVSPQALAAARGGVEEGLAWLGREPESRASLLYRVPPPRSPGRSSSGRSGSRSRRPGRSISRPAATSSSGRSTAAGWTRSSSSTPCRRSRGSGSSAAAHRRSRVAGARRSSTGSAGCSRSGAAASGSTSTSPPPRAVLRNGGVFVLMPEGGISGPPDALAPFRFGAGLICLRTEAPIVPLAIGGSDELYLGRRMATRVLAPTTAGSCSAPSGRDVLPEEGSRGGARPGPSADGAARRAPRAGRRPSSTRPTVDPPGIGPRAPAAGLDLAPACLGGDAERVYPRPDAVRRIRSSSSSGIRRSSG